MKESVQKALSQISQSLDWAYLAWIIIAVGQHKRLVVLFFCTFEQYCSTVDEKCMLSAV